MIIADVSVIAASSLPSVMAVQAAAIQSAAANRPHIIGVCSYVQLFPDGDDQERITPVVVAQSYHGSSDLGGNINSATATVRLIQPPQHGKLMIHDDLGEWTTEIKDWSDTEYVPDKDYKGNDFLIMEVEDNGVTVQVHYFLSVKTGSTAGNPACKDHEYAPWDISATFSQTPSDNTLYSQNNIPLFGYQLKNVNVSLNIASLPDGKLGETTGHDITLDDNGAGCGWFIDPTPGRNKRKGRAALGAVVSAGLDCRVSGYQVFEGS